jgi:hypothetical protein
MRFVGFACGLAALALAGMVYAAPADGKCEPGAAKAKAAPKKAAKKA